MKTPEEFARDIVADVVLLAPQEPAAGFAALIHKVAERDCQHEQAAQQRIAEARAAAFREAVMIARQYADGIATRVAVSVAQGIGDRIEETAKR